MKYIVSISSAALLSLGIISSPLIETEQAIAIGCDTYERVTGDFGNCKGGSTQYARQLWMEKYVVCLQQQLSQEVTLYNQNSNVQVYYDDWNQGSGEKLDLNQISFENETLPTMSMPQSQLSAYQSNLELCNN